MVGWLSNNLFRRFNLNDQILKIVAERSRDSRRRSRDRRPTVEQHSIHVSSKSNNFSKKSLNGDETVVGHATVGWLSKNLFRRCSKKGDILKKVAERSLDSRRRSRDRLSNKNFRRFKQIGIFFKVAERLRDSCRSSRIQKTVFDEAYQWSFIPLL